MIAAEVYMNLVNKTEAAVEPGKARFYVQTRWLEVPPHCKLCQGKLLLATHPFTLFMSYIRCIKSD